MQTLIHEVMWVTGFIGLIISICLIIALLRSKVASISAQLYAIGAAIAFNVGGTYIFVTAFFFSFWNLVGLFGGYVFLVIALIQYNIDRRTTITPDVQDHTNV